MSRNDRLYQGVRGRKILENLNINIVTELRHPTAEDYEEIFGQNHPLASSENILCHESASKEYDALVPSSCVEFPNIASRTPSPSIIESFGMPSCSEPSNGVASPMPSSLTDKETRPYSSDDTLLPNNYQLSLKSKSLSLSDLTDDSVSPYTHLKKYLSLPLLNDNYTLNCSENLSPSVMVAFHSNLQNHNLNLSSDTETDFESDHDENDLHNMNEGRKRRQLALPGEWKRNKAKLKRMQGEEYLGFSNPPNRKFQQDTLRSARILGPRCTSDFCLKSKLRECDKLSEECRQSIHSFFWKHMNWDQRKIYVNSLVKRSKTAQKTTTDQSRRLETAAYFLPVNSDGSEKVQVCKNMFLNTLSVGSFTVYSWTKHSEYGMSPNQAVRNLSRRSPVRPEIRRKLLTLTSFLDNLPKLPSHYARKETTKLFLEPIYHSIADLFKIYKKHCTDTEELSVSRFTFEKHFHAKNLYLYTLKKDMCDVCASYKAGNLCEADYQIHLIKKNRARQEKDNDKKKAAEGEFILLSMDLEAVKVCPYLTASALYFKTKLTIHNFTVFDLITKQCTCYWFDETAADLTSSTFVSFLVDYIERNCISRQLPIVVYSDGCTYQNRNAVMANALLNLSKKYNIEITQKFLEPGHTQMECDSVHAAIERKLKNREIHLPSEYGTLTKEVRKSDPYEVIQIDHQFVKNYASPECHFYKSIRPGRKVGDPQVVDIRAIKYNTMTIETKLNFDDEFTPLPQRPKILDMEIEYQQLHPNRIPIKALKYNHLQQLKAVLPSDCHAFYDGLPFE